MPARTLRERIEAILHRVERPPRYIGGEWNQVIKRHADTRIKIALCFPDVYEIGMSHLGYRLLYAILNRRPDMLAERAFTPWPDMQEELARAGLPLTTLETCTPISRFDVVGFSLQYELCFTNVLSTLSLGGIPLRSADRGDDDPLVIAGGPVVFNPEPVADFIDAFVIGDGEETAIELSELFVDLREAGRSRGEILEELGRMPGVYVPSLYPVRQDAATGFLIRDRSPVESVPFPVQRRILMDIESFPYPADVVVPFTEIVHDRVSVEIMRGCQVGCRFCQAGYIYRPVRERSHASVMETARASLLSTGYDEVGLTSLNSGEYPGINRLISEMMDEMVERRTAVSFSSLRASSVTDHLAKQIRRVRKTGFTIAPEAGTDRMRRVINKNISEADILSACEMAFSNGWSHIKLYFMIGQPTETWEDVEGILDVGKKCLAVGRKYQGHRARVSLSASSFIPKPFTPFQWCRMDRIESIRRKQNWLKAGCERAGIHFKWHHPEVSRLEGVFSVGDRALCDVVEAAWRRGCSFDGWTEKLDVSAWMEAFAACGVDPEVYLARDFGPEDALPWDHLDIGVTRKFLAKELEKALAVHDEETCGGDKCYGCAPVASACTGFLHGRRTGETFFGGVGARGPVSAAVPGGSVRLPAFQPHAPADPARPAPSIAPAADATEDEPAVYRYRACFTKLGPLRFLSQLDMARLLARGFRRAGVPLAYSQGFHPMPKMAFGPALPVGIASEGEYLDFETTRFVRHTEFVERVNRFLPSGVRFTAAVPLPRRTVSLSKAINRVVYGARPAGRLPRVSHRAVEDLLAARSIPYLRVREQKRKTVDLRPFVADIEVNGGADLRLEFHMNNGQTAKPHEVLDVLCGEGSADIPVTREALLVVQNERRFSPLLTHATSGTRDPGQR
ncbi:MAG: TIGR03960 family B12-binding radical SAM protein [Acidobacteriota bacterium]